jgi:hypothetical protein
MGLDGSMILFSSTILLIGHGGWRGGVSSDAVEVLKRIDVVTGTSGSLIL